MTHRRALYSSQAASLVTAALVALLSLASGAASGEPYLAVRTGAKCVACHVNPTGGGKRNEFGNTYSQTTLARERLTLGTTPEPAPWNGKLNEFFAVGADLRATARGGSEPDATDTYEFSQTRAQVYLEFKPIGERLSIYLDERLAPGSATNRETYALLWFADQSVYVKAGRLFVPFGLRIEDDSAFIRQFSGVNFSSSDDGVEVGMELGPWSANLSVTNGAGGGAENNRSKQISALATFVQPIWRAGISASTNSSGAAERRMQSVFAGLRTGFVGWLASVVYITDEAPSSARLEHWASLVEANIEAAKGHNVKLTYEYYDPNRKVAEDQRARYSVVWEFVPFQFTQFRLGARKNDGIPQNSAQNASEVFLQWHAFF